MKVEFNLTDQEVQLLGKLLGYSPVIITDVEVEDEETGLMRLESVSTPNPYTIEQFVSGAFVKYKDTWIEKAMTQQIHDLAKATEAALTSKEAVSSIIEAVKASPNGIADLKEIVKSQI